MHRRHRFADRVDIQVGTDPCETRKHCLGSRNVDSSEFLLGLFEKIIYIYTLAFGLNASKRYSVQKARIVVQDCTKAKDSGV